MKTLTCFLTALALLCVAAPAARAQDDAAITVDYFYDALAPYGDWVHVEGYGYCFQPFITVEDPEWRPYTDGSWAYTDSGWTWVSNEDFGWATYHYGRWMRAGNNWLWVPGVEWAPAWVSWRSSAEYVGWAPLPPEAVWQPDVGFSVSVDTSYDIGPSYYCFIPVRYIGAPRIRQYVEPWQRNLDYIRRTENCTQISYHRSDSRLTSIFIGGPSYVEINRYSERPVRRMQIRRDSSFNSRDRRSWKAREEGDSLIVAAPRIDRGGDRKAPPAERIKARLERAVVDRGWRGVRAEDASGLRDKVKREAAESDARSRRSGSPPDAGRGPGRRDGPDGIPSAQPVPAIPGSVPQVVPPDAIPGRDGRDGRGPNMRRPGADRRGPDSSGVSRGSEDPVRPPVGPGPGAMPRESDPNFRPEGRRGSGPQRPPSGTNTVSPEVPRPGGVPPTQDATPPRRMPPVEKPDIVPPSRERRGPVPRNINPDAIPKPDRTPPRRPDVTPVPVSVPTPRNVAPPESRPRPEPRRPEMQPRRPEISPPQQPQRGQGAPSGRENAGGGGRGGSRGERGERGEGKEDKDDRKGRR